MNLDFNVDIEQPLVFPEQVPAITGKNLVLGLSMYCENRFLILTEYISAINYG